MDEDEFFEKVQPINLKYCDPPKSEAKIRSQIRWIMQKEPCSATGVKVVLGSQVEVEETPIELPPDVVPRHISARVDYIDQLAHELTSGTHLPFNYARELIKLMLLASLPATRPRLEWFPVHTRQYLILIGEVRGFQESCGHVCQGRGRGFILPRKHHPGRSFRESTVRSLGAWWNSHQAGKGAEVSIEVHITGRKGNGQVVHYDEGQKLLQNDALGTGERGLMALFTQLFDSNRAGTGSFKNGKAEVDQANASLILNFTRADFNCYFVGTGAQRGGFLSRCTLVSDYKEPVDGEWRLVNTHEVRGLIRKLYECTQRTSLPEDEDARILRLEVISAIRQQDPAYSARLEFLFVQDLYVRSLCSEQGRITRGAVLLAKKWIEHQLLSRRVLWPWDASKDKYEAMELRIRAIMRVHHKLSEPQLAKLVNARCEGSGGLKVFHAALKNLLAAGEIKVIGKTKKGRPVYEWVGD